MFSVTGSRSPSPLELGAVAPSQGQLTTSINLPQVEGEESFALSERRVTAVPIPRVSPHINPTNDSLLLTVSAFPWLRSKIDVQEVIDTKTRDRVGRSVFALGCLPEITFIQQGLPTGFCIDIDFNANVSAEDDSRYDDFYWSHSGVWCNSDVKTKDGKDLGHVNQRGVCVVMDGKNEDGHYRDYSMAWWAYHCSTKAHYPQPQHQHHHKKGKRAPVDSKILELKLSESLLKEPPELRGLLCDFYTQKEKALDSTKHYEFIKSSHTSSKETRNTAKAQKNKDCQAFKVSSKCLKAYIKENLS